MKVEKVYTATISKEEREKVVNAFDVLDTFLGEIDLDRGDITFQDGYAILCSIDYQDEDVCVGDEEIVLKYEH